MSRLARVASALAVVIAAAVLAELPWFRAASQAIDRVRQPLLGVALGLTGLGFCAFMGGILSLLMAEGAAANEASLGAMREAWRSGDWRRDAAWRRLFLIVAGAGLLFYGMFGLFLVIGPPPIRVLVAGALAYATLMAIRGVARAPAPSQQP